ncbi:ABC transporter substrate-binding protein [Alicyclobacillus sp. ALC3]|uniref:ABC transporter substrate-binding protein n=1 Tax=Alicyclobacillus sp. ALC3 TaxID=2796143 RepID=UPI002379F651|nr:ABC transporter substrate-binding protein [Alicyclobacillus sp. ALC3]WDL95876.1 hypothetical protein JC200_16145 [Alicyclobacillus sp. ALC3]
MKKLSRASIATIALAGSLTVLVAGCGAANTTGGSGTGGNTTTASGTPVNGGTLSIGQFTKWSDNFIPGMDSSLYTANVYSFVFDPLFSFNNKLELTPWLVQSYSYSNGNKTITMHLQPNANWSDGQPITSQDVLLYMNFVGSKTYNTTLQGQYGYLVGPVKGSAELLSGKATSFTQTGGFKIINSKTFQINLTTADASALAADLSSITPVPYHILGKVPFSQWKTNAENTLPKVVSGPYIPTAADGAGSLVQLKANTKYWKGAPHISNINIKYVSQNTEGSLVMSHQLGFALNGLTPTDYLTLTKASGVSTKTLPALGFEYLGLHDNSAPWNNATLRQAVMYGIDHKAIINNIEKGLASKIVGPIPSVSWAYTSQGMNQYNYSVSKAKSLIQSQGYKMGSNGYYQKNGQTLGFTITIGQGSTTGQEIADLIASDLKQVGVKVTVNTPLAFTTLITDLENNSKSIQGWIAGWSLGTDPDPRGLWGSQDAMNFERWVNPQDDTLIKNTWSLPSDFTQAGRKAAFAPWERLVNQQVPLIFLYENNNSYAFTSKLNIPASDWTSAGELPLNPQQWWLSK